MHHFKAFDMINLQYEIKILEKILNKAMSKFLSPSLKHNNRDYPNMGYPLNNMYDANFYWSRLYTAPWWTV